MPRIFVLGSLNADLVVAVPRPVQPGETLSGGELTIFPGGKGGNQAVAAARLGAEALMVGQVGRDAFGDFLLDRQRAAGVMTGGIGRCGRASGVALISIFPDGENSIVISPGANAAVTPRLVREHLTARGRRLPVVPARDSSRRGRGRSAAGPRPRRGHHARPGAGPPASAGVALTCRLPDPESD